MSVSGDLSGRFPARAGRLLRFLIVGGAFSLIYALVTALLIGKAGLPAYSTSVVVYMLCIPAAFAVQKRFTFRLSRARRTAFALYTGTQVMGLALVAAVTTRFVTHVVAIDTLIFLATAGLVAVFSFAFSSLITFRPPE